MGIPMFIIEEEMPIEELNMWRIWMQEPRGEKRADWHAAQISHMVYQISQMFTRSRNNIPVKKFLLEFGAGIKDDKFSQLLALQKAFKVIPREVLVAERKNDMDRRGITAEPQPLVKGEEAVEQMDWLKKAFNVED